MYEYYNCNKGIAIETEFVNVLKWRTLLLRLDNALKSTCGDGLEGVVSW